MSMLLEVYTFGLIFSLASILLVGFAWSCILRRYNFLDIDNAASGALTAFALGFCWHAFVFAAFYFLRIPIDGAWKVKRCFDVAILVWATSVGRDEARHIYSMTFKSYHAGFLIVGAMLGTWAFFVFPNALDSGQVKAVQTLLLRGTSQGVSTIGYSGLALFATQFVGDFPVVTVAGTFKPLLSMIVASTAYYAIVTLDLPHRNLNATILLALIVLSTFGTYGIVERGKDSIFGVIFSFAFVLTMCRLDASRRGAEMAIYFAAAAATGIISVPFMIIAYGLWLLSAQNHTNALATLKYLYLANIPILPFVVAGFLDVNPLLLLGGFLALGTMGFVGNYLIHRYGVVFRQTNFRFQETYILILLGLIFACIVLMPVQLDLGMIQNPDGTLRVLVRQPLDGKTTFVEYLLNLKIQLVTVAVGIVASILLMVNKFGKDRPGLFVLASMLFAMLAGVLACIHLKITFLPNFHIWDLAKDTQMWYGGLVFSVLALTGINWLVWALVPRRAQVITILAAAALMVVWPIKQLQFNRYMTFATETSIGGFQEQANAVILEILWRKFKDIPVYLTLAGRGSGRRDFGDLCMFGPSDVRWYTASVAKQFDICCQKIGLIVGQHEVQGIENLATAKGATVTHVATVDNGATEILLIAMKTAP